MKKIEMKYKLLALCGFFLVVILTIQIFHFTQTKQINDHMDDISEIQLPAVRKLSLIDMYHDSLQGLVYKSLFAAEKNQIEMKKEVSEDLNESIDLIKRYLNELDQLNLKNETKIAINETRPAINKYVELASSISNFALNDKRTEALAQLDEFSASFSFLEDKLATLGNLIVKDSENSRQNAKTFSSQAGKFNLILLILSLAIGLISTIAVVSTLMNGITKTVEEVSQSVHELQNSSQKMSLVSQRLSTCVDTQVSSISGSVTAMDEISAMIKNNDHSATTAAARSEQTKSSAEVGQDTVNRMISEMKDISVSYDEIQSNVIRNGEEIKKVIDVIAQIANKTQVINDIVFQTKLLSFNASVEAARAGESGKGFAVVAQEIGNLAEMSGKASTEISRMLSDSQDQVKAIAESTTKSIGQIVERGRNKAQNGNIVAENCLKELNQIIHCVNDLDLSIHEISNAIKEQSKGVDEVNTALKQLDATTSESTEMSNKSKEASEDLSQQSHNLRVSIQDLRKVLGSKKAYDAPSYEEFVKNA